MKRHTIIINEKQYKTINNYFENTLLENFQSNTFSLEYLKTNNWENAYDLLEYCYRCNLQQIGEGSSRIVFQISDELVIKIQYNQRSKQNKREIESYYRCTKDLLDFIPNIFDYDNKHENPLWIIAEQVLTARYADFQKILGIDFGNFASYNDAMEMKQDLKDYSKYKGKTVDKNSLNLTRFLDDYADGEDMSKYEILIKSNKWLQELYTLLENNIVDPWEIQLIQNWGLVKRNGQPKLIILDIGY